MECDRPKAQATLDWDCGTADGVSMTEFTAKPEHTYALVVGIERYQERCWNVEDGGPAHDALRFAQWLCDRGVPKENIRLCLSPLEENGCLVEQSELEVETATEQSISYIITEFLSQQRGDLLYFFWAGHGLITSERERRLIWADATSRNWQNLDLNSLLVFFSSNLFQIPHHICIVDACANYLLESEGRPTNLGGKIFASGHPRTEIQQFVLLATREGEEAEVSGERKTGFFSEAVREALAEEQPNCWPPNMKAVAEKITKQFKESGKKQRPTYLYYQDSQGNKNVASFRHFETLQNIRPSKAVDSVGQKVEFVGRQQELERLHQLFQDNQVVEITDVTGQGGVGKTELAIQYSWNYLEEYSGGCCWLFPRESDVGTQLVDFAIVNFPNFTLPAELSLNNRVPYCLKKWPTGNVLVVFDDVTDSMQIQPYLQLLGSRFKVLITTRQTGVRYKQLPLGELSPDAALKLLAQLLGEERVKQELEFAQKLCKFVGYLPVGLYQVAANYRGSGRGLC